MHLLNYLSSNGTLGSPSFIAGNILYPILSDPLYLLSLFKAPKAAKPR